MLSVVSAGYDGGTVDMTAEGVEDWMAAQQLPGTTMRAQTPNNQPTKLLGGRILLYFDWANPGGTGFTQATTITKTATAADNVQGTLVNSNLGVGFFDAAILQLGWRVRVPASPLARRLRCYTSHFSSILTCTARMNDGTPDVVATYDSGAAAAARRQWTIDYSSNTPESQLTASWKITTGWGSTPNILLVAITLGRP